MVARRDLVFSSYSFMQLISLYFANLPEQLMSSLMMVTFELLFRKLPIIYFCSFYMCRYS